MRDWYWELDPKDLLDGLPPQAVDEVGRLAREIVARDSLVYLDGISYTGPGPGLRTETRGALMITYLTDVRGQRVVIVQVVWFG